MASLAKDGSGWRILFCCPTTRKRPTIRLGKCSKKSATTALNMTENLIEAKSLGVPIDQQTIGWLNKIDVKLRDRLAKVNLAPEANAAILGTFLTAYIEGRANLKPNTLRNYRVTEQHLLKHFGADRELSTITPGDAEDWRERLLRDGKAIATVNREVKRAKQYFEAAKKRELIADNPFADLKGGKQENQSRLYFVSPEDTQKVIDACPDAQWRLIVALARYGGLRTPSETLALTWDDVLWDQERIVVHSPKTEHIEGRTSRVIPLFPELRPHLDEVWETAEKGNPHVVTRYRDSRANLRTQFERIIARAGLEPWPKLFQNLRSTRETELAREHPIHVVCDWIGNSELVAAKHYLQVTDEDFKAAVASPRGLAQFPAQSPLKLPHQGRPRKRRSPIKPRVDGACGRLMDVKAPPRGVEPRLPD